MNETRQGKKFAAFDIDGTIFRWQLYHELFDALGESGYISEADRKAVNNAREAWGRREHSFADYEHLLVEVMESRVIGMSEQTIIDLSRSILEQKGHRTYGYTRALLQDLQNEGYFIIAISASYQQQVDSFAELHDIDLAIGTDFEIQDGKFTRTKQKVFGRKGELLKTVVEAHDLSWKDSYAVGDSSSDAAMMELVEHPIAFNPDDKLFDIATSHNWKIVLERKNMIYELERSEDTNGSYILANANIR